MTLTLYSYFRSGSSWRVRIALNFKGLKYSMVPIHLLKREQNKPEYRAISPQGMVPALVVTEEGTGGASHTLTQSVAIIEYLEEIHPGPRLLPKDPFQRARVRQLTEIVNSSIQPFQNLSVLKKVGDELNGDRKAWAADFITRGLGAFETLVSEQRATFAVGDQPTVADAFLVPQLFAARRFDVDLSPFPTCLAIEAACSKIEAFQAARPENQPDHER